MDFESIGRGGGRFRFYIGANRVPVRCRVSPTEIRGGGISRGRRVLTVGMATGRGHAIVVEFIGRVEESIEFVVVGDCRI